MQSHSCLKVELYRAQPPSRRTASRKASTTAASLRASRAGPEPIRLSDISERGCGFEARWSFSVGARVWLKLPGLEPWEARIIWFEGGRGGLEFARQLHPAVALRFAE